MYISGWLTPVVNGKLTKETANFIGCLKYCICINDITIILHEDLIYKYVEIHQIHM